MSTSDRTFNQVKAILGKLDRAVDEARSRRTTPPQPKPAPALTPSAPAATTTIAQAQPAETQLPATGTTGRPGSQYGRAQPIRPQNANPIRWTNAPRP